MSEQFSLLSAKPKAERVTFHVVAKSISVAIERDEAGAITSISASGLDDIRNAALIAINTGIQRGRSLPEQALRVLALSEMIAGLIRVDLERSKP